MKKDPHLAFARGGRADFRGRNGAYYAFLSTPGLQVNVRTEEATFKSYRDALTIDGSFITEVHVLALVGGEKHKLATASFWTSELNEFTTGPNMINGTCGDRGQFFLGAGGHKKCEELEVAIKFSSARFMLPGWTFKVAANRVWGHISGPVHRLDVSLHQTHGLVGQSFAWRSARDGKRDLYPSEGRFRTSAMGEGAIEGDATMYELAGPLATEFPFSRFREAKKPMLLPLPAGAATVDASSSDQVEVAGAASAPPDERRLYEKLAGVAQPCAPPSSPPPTVAFQRGCSCSDNYTKPGGYCENAASESVSLARSECLSACCPPPPPSCPAASTAELCVRSGHGAYGGTLASWHNTCKASMSSTSHSKYDASHLIDGHEGQGTGCVGWTGECIAHSEEQTNAWLEIDLGETAFVSKIEIYNRDDVFANRLANFEVALSNSPYDSIDPSNPRVICNTHTAGASDHGPVS